MKGIVQIIHPEVLGFQGASVLHRASADMAWECRVLRPLAGGTAAAPTPRKARRVTTPETTIAILAGSQSLLELNKVRRASTQERYHNVLQIFYQWCQHYFPITRDWDALLTAYLNELHAQEENVSAGEYVYAAFKHKHPQFGKYGSLSLPRATQALEGYRNLTPAKMRLPTPRVAFMAIVGAMLVKHLVTMVIALLLQWDLLLRPGELITLTPQQLIPPAEGADMQHWGVILAPSESSGDPTKTNLYDEGLSLSPKVGFLTEAIQQLRRRRASCQVLFPFTCAQLLAEFKAAALQVGVSHLGATLYGNRHGGASDLRLQGASLADIKKRGRWTTDSSLRRYEKATLAQQQFHKVPPPTRLYGAFVEERLPATRVLLAKAVASPNCEVLTAISQHFKPLPDVN